MNRKKEAIKISVVLILILGLIVNLFTIYTFPSWFDEAYFANISFNLANGKGFLQDLIPGYNNGQVLIYGPVYFFLQSQLIHLFGLDQFVFRLPNLVAGYLSVFLLYKILRDRGCNQTFSLLFLAAAIVDVSFNRNLVYGRMDLAALLFVILALFLTHRIEFQKKSGYLVQWLLVGLLSTAAYLTTPRALFLLPIVFVMAFYKLFVEPKSKISAYQWIAATGASLVFIVPIFLWIQYAGGFEEYASFFRARESVSSHIGVSFFRSFYDNVTIGIFIVMVLIYIQTVIKKPLLIGAVLTYLSFSFFVEEHGPYAAMITPILIAGIFYILSESVSRRFIQYSLSALIIVPGLFLIFLRGADLLANSDCRDSTNIPELINEPSNQKIIAPFKYYFFAENENREVVTFNRAKIDRKVLVKDADLIVSSNEMSDFLNRNNFEKVAEITCKPTKLPFLPGTFYERSTYTETFYNR
ncbi:ArnT family glycosyltransferase [Rhodohalobacter sulfatireducens]|uniref:Glycosyltransferase family 39 protein n=1 Tax=Rhodohalobacter sulfatireducens TaxID=2911366 RepID=A0ABS9K890_9BACT|nr:glycosyltransferase family 39 protein [Rhodohalobacter sulfatireducens]MCG2587074.1 glycosyltransferase family 39 protein [Rhodohalobacter sulfatireducens]